tara:strand:- start:347 stop:1015 length:669 start_codon:yes stop_codon:yes gene_type:complete
MFIKDKITRNGEWDSRSEYMGKGIVDKTLGFIGFGNIGAEIVKLAKVFDMNFIAYDPYADKKKLEDLGVKVCEINEVFKNADILSINCALTDETRHIVNEERLSLMKKSSYLINTSRGPVVDQNALYNILSENKIAGAGLDVFETEPLEMDDKILKLDNTILAPHSLCWTDQMFYQCGKDDIDAAKDVMEGKIPKNIVNKEILKNENWIAKLQSYEKKYFNS